ncbi:MAG: EamA family transporter RarD, partial [Spirochaetota bacterium]
MIRTQRASRISASLGGTLAGFAAYGIWGMFPLYWRQLTMVEPLQILAHRVFWAGAFCLVLVLAKGRGAEILRLAKSGKTFAALAFSTLVVTFNWGLYIWAVNSGRIIESALGYYI